MRKLALSAFLLVAVASCRDAAGPAATTTQARVLTAPAAQADRVIPGEYIVVFKNDVTDVPGLANQLARTNGAAIRFTYRHALKGFAAAMAAPAADALSRNPNVAFVEEDQAVEAIGLENMDSAGDPWGLDRIDATAGLDKMYHYSLTGSGVHAYIIDTGILTTHTEFGTRASGGMTAINDGNGMNDCNGHGTHVSGTVGGKTYGVAKDVLLVAVRVLGCNGSGSWSGVIAGIDWVTVNAEHPAVANMSLGGGASSAVDLAVSNSIASGVSYAVAAGNGNKAGVAQDACNYSPSRVPAAMTIGATSKTDAKTSWSNYGSCVDWFAPGLNIKSAWNTSNTATNTISGTSMATPHTTGVAALYLESNPTASAAEVRDALFAATTKGIVTSSNTTNNNLLYSPPTGFGPPSANTPPTASFSKSCTGLTCTFTDLSTDADGSIASRSWDFGDGGNSTAQNPSHTFGAAGTYTVSLTVTDNDGATGSTSQAVAVTNPPIPTIALNVTGSKVKGTWTASLTWSGATTTLVDIYRNGAKIKAVTNDSSTGGTTSDSGKGSATNTYQVCEAGSTSACSSVLTVSM